MPTPSAKWAFPVPLDADPADVPSMMDAYTDVLEASMAGYAEGTFAARPAAGKSGRFYKATDTGKWYLDNGAAWKELPLTTGGRGKSIVATEESRTNTAYGLLATPDRVQSVVLPTDGLIVVACQALWKESVVGAARAAIFIGANQLKIQTLTAPAVSEANLGGTVAEYRPLSSVHSGLASLSGSAHGSDVATGQVVGASVNVGGVAHVFAGAGTYDVSVQFKASSGSVTAKERKLWVWTEEF